MKHAKIFSATVLTTVFLTVNAQEQIETPSEPTVEDDLPGVISVAAFDLPISAYVSEESKAAMEYFRENYAGDMFTFQRDCGNLYQIEGDLDKAKEIRECISRNYLQTSIYKDTLKKHPVEVSAQDIAGVYTEIFVPEGGISEENEDRILISIHGGGFVAGARSFSHTESIQVAHLGRIKVVSPDYRQAPEYEHPAAIDDVVAVYTALLDDYDAANIGIYGCSAGAMLTAQTIAKLLQEDMPLPGAIGLFCAGAPFTMDGVPGAFKMSNGESAYIVQAQSGNPRPKDSLISTRVSGYFRNVETIDPLVAPGDFDQVMSAFPPTLLISGTRDFAMSAVIATHQRLTKLGVDADLHIWEGMGHATFAFNPRLPESDEVHTVIVRFFARRLGT